MSRRREVMLVDDEVLAKLLMLQNTMAKLIPTIYVYAKIPEDVIRQMHDAAIQAAALDVHAKTADPNRSMHLSGEVERQTIDFLTEIERRLGMAPRKSQ